MSRFWALLRMATLADGVVAIATLALVAALMRPSWNARDFRNEVASAIADANTVMSGARNARAALGRWPTAADAGEAPPELANLGGDGGVFTRPGYALAWTTWEVVDSVPAPPEPELLPTPGDAPREPEGSRMLPVTRTVGAVAVHSSNPRLLAELLRHFGGETSFVLDSIWLMLLPERLPESLPRR